MLSESEVIELKGLREFQINDKQTEMGFKFSKHQKALDVSGSLKRCII